MTKKVPMRTCIGCGQIREKGKLIRIVRTPEGEILADPAGRAHGRGAYLCASPECLEKARRRRALSRAFGTGVAGDQYEQLRAQMEALASSGKEEPDGGNDGPY